MRGFWKRLAGQGETRKASSKSAERPNILCPDAPFCAVGDIHGCDELLDGLLQKLPPIDEQKLVFVGDYVDRGPASAQVLHRLFDMSQRHPDRVICLLGNHERMMRQFIDDPLGKGARWLRFGGLDTLRSFGLPVTHKLPAEDDALDMCEAFEAALPNGMIAWLDGLPKLWQSGNIWCVHAGMDPDAAPDEQRSNTLVWGHPDFLTRPREDDVCVLHGHTIVPAPTNADSRISIDTGAYETGVLTAAQIDTDACTFVTAMR